MGRVGQEQDEQVDHQELFLNSLVTRWQAAEEMEVAHEFQDEPCMNEIVTRRQFANEYETLLASVGKGGKSKGKGRSGGSMKFRQGGKGGPADRSRPPPPRALQSVPAAPQRGQATVGVAGGPP